MGVPVQQGHHGGDIDPNGLTGTAGTSWRLGFVQTSSALLAWAETQLVLFCHHGLVFGLDLEFRIVGDICDVFRV